MKLGAYTACLHDSSLPETLKILGELGLTGAEINAGGFVPAPHLPIEQLQHGGGAVEAYLKLFDQAGITLTGLNVNGNPLNPDPEVGPKHAADLKQAIELAALLLKLLFNFLLQLAERLSFFLQPAVFVAQLMPEIERATLA